jgi:hypothetical protein
MKTLRSYIQSRLASVLLLARNVLARAIYRLELTSADSKSACHTKLANRYLT